MTSLQTITVKFHWCHKTTEKATESGTSLERQGGVGGAGLRTPIRENIGGVILKRQDSVNRVLRVLFADLVCKLTSAGAEKVGCATRFSCKQGVKKLLVHAASVPATAGVFGGPPPQTLQRGRGCSAFIRRTAHPMHGSWAPDCRNPFPLGIEVGESVAKG